MHRRIWLLAGAAVAVLLVASSATATSRTTRTAVAPDATPAAAPFAQAWAKVPRTTAGRKAASTVVFAIDEDINGFNNILNCCNELVAGYMGELEAQHGAFLQNPKGDWVKDLVSSATVTGQTLSYTIKPNAYWYWGGKKVPVTYKDFVYTLQKIDDPKSNVVQRDGYDALSTTHYTHNGDRQVTFYWRTSKCTAKAPCGPYANWQSLFSGLYPSFALKGMDFNKIWTSCICGSDGKPVSNGPYYVSNYTKGQGSVLKVNPFWGGTKPAIKEVDFKLILDDNAEVQALRGGEVDAITPNFGLNLAPLLNAPGITFNKIPGYYFEHIELREGNHPGATSLTKGASNPLLLNPWMRQAIMMGINRQAIINTIYGPLAKGLTPMNNGLYYATQAPYKEDFAKWNYNPQKAVALLAQHCSGGPTSPDPSNTKVWTCSGYPAKFNWMTTTGQAPRQTSEAIATAELKSIGIAISDAAAPASVVFSNNGVFGGGYDIGEFAEITSGDPSDWTSFYGCKGDGNFTGFCSVKADKLMKAGDGELDTAKRAADYQKADQILAQYVPVIPLYQRPVPLIYKSSLLGMVNNPTTYGPFWNIEDWHWKS